MSEREWIGVDLDGTLAHYDGWKGAEHIGAPIVPMVRRVKNWLRNGKQVKVFTARVAHPGARWHVEDWLEENGLGNLDVTNVKDMHMIELWDDRCVQVKTNTGMPIRENGAAR